MLLVHKIELKPNNKQATYFAKGCGVARFAYNWALARWQEQYDAGEKPTEGKLRKALNAIKREEFPWMSEVTKVAPQQAIKNLGMAFTRFFNKQGAYPKFKKKGQHDSFRADNGPVKAGANAVKIVDKTIQLPRLGWVRMKEQLRYHGQVKSVVISRRAGRWYAAISVETENFPHSRKSQGLVGVDLGLTTLATTSEQESVEAPRALNQLLKRLRCYSKQLSRKKKGSRNYGKSVKKLAALHGRIRDVRVNSLHHLTTKLVLNYDVICVEDLNISGMLKNKRLSRHIMDRGFYEFKRQLKYKAEWYDSKIIEADRFFPSSKRCHLCHLINTELKLSQRHWRCDCGALLDREDNAAQNLKQYAELVFTGSSSEINACGVESAG